MALAILGRLAEALQPRLGEEAPTPLAQPPAFALSALCASMPFITVLRCLTRQMNYYANRDLPFGGTRLSGMGRFHRRA